MSVITVLNESGDYARIAEIASEALELKGEISVELETVSMEEIRALNLSQRGVDRPTDVLSFPSLQLSAGEYKPFTAENFPFDFDPDTKCVCLGSIVICDEIASRQAVEYGHSVERERGYLFLHGLLHLLGYDHIEDADRGKMREAEERILSLAGLERE